MSEDPARDGSNWYSYVGNDPINRWDPRGLIVESVDSRWQMGPNRPWSDTPISPGYTIGNVGCVLTWFSNVISQSGTSVNPGQLVTGNPEYFDRDGNLDWGIAGEYGYERDYFTRAGQNQQDHRNGLNLNRVRNPFEDKVRSLFDDQTNVYALSAEVDLKIGGRWGNHTVGVNGISDDGQWLAVSETSGFDTAGLRNSQSWGENWMEKDGKLWVKLSAVNKVNTLQRTRPIAQFGDGTASADFYGFKIPGAPNASGKTSTGSGSGGGTGTSTTPSQPREVGDFSTGSKSSDYY